MEIVGCANSECTVAATGMCVLSHRVEECPNVEFEKVTASRAEDGSNHVPSLLGQTEDAERFPSSLTMGLDDVRALMKNEQCHLIGLVGEPNSGKTACLVSFYLLLARNRLEGFTFADSKSLMALDQLSRGARSWPGEMPEQLTAHTELGDDRVAGFLHFKIVGNSDGVGVHLIVPDLPGEWTKSLIDGGPDDRLGFLRSADTVWVMVDGQTLIARDKRQGAIHRVCLLIGRLVDYLGCDVPDIRLVVSRQDLGEPEADTIQEVLRRADRYGVRLSVSHIASFAANEGAGGRGISDLIGKTLARMDPPDLFWTK